MTNTNSQIACSLSGAKGKHEVQEIRDAIRPHLLNSSFAKGRLELEFSKSGVNRQDLETLINLEKSCCGFLNFDLNQNKQTIVLGVEGPEGAETLVMEFFAAEPAIASSNCGCSSQKDAVEKEVKRPRFSKGGIGVVSLCVVACSIPYILVALGLIGTSTAAYLNGGVEAAIAGLLVMGAGFYFWPKLFGKT